MDLQWRRERGLVPKGLFRSASTRVDEADDVDEEDLVRLRREVVGGEACEEVGRKNVNPMVIVEVTCCRFNLVPKSYPQRNGRGFNLSGWFILGKVVSPAATGGLPRHSGWSADMTSSLQQKLGSNQSIHESSSIAKKEMHVDKSKGKNKGCFEDRTRDLPHLQHL